ncbi:YihY/virulence factor BrkB family protein [Gynurincola endophyticus]|jgi:membrane protein|uniref:YihY/virulence factor BrkB family protein n=1 Tax=Gynurincola endophyticus TaxID=2479004 RepID=UPI000F8F0495|nr:YihY/virulence factor BrkB family protein [Gynurincola endophyticus]
MKKIKEYFFNLRLVKSAIKGSQHWKLPGFDGVTLYDVVIFFEKQVEKVGLSERAAAISYNFIMAIPPTCLFFFTLIPQLPFVNNQALQRQIRSLITDMIPAPEYNAQIINFIDTFFESSRVGLLSFGFLLLIFFASNGMMGIMRSFNKEYIGFQKRTDFQARLAAIKLTFILLGLLFLTLLLLSLQGFVLRWLGIEQEWLIALIKFSRWIFILALVFYAIAFIYKFAPAIPKKWKLSSPGAILATTLCILATLGFSLFVNNFGKYNALYGSIGTIIVLMTIIYINSLVLLIGYELNISIHSLKTIAQQREKQESQNT